MLFKAPNAAHGADMISVIISHRFSTVRRADSILVLHAGSIIEAGSHDQLLIHAGVYAKLFDLQARGYRDDPQSALAATYADGHSLEPKPNRRPKVSREPADGGLLPASCRVARRKNAEQIESAGWFRC